MNEPSIDFVTTKKCPQCGKLFTVLWPHQWTYWRGNVKNKRYFCTYSCVRAYDKKKEEKKVGKPRQLSQEQREKAIQICIDGGDPLKYLEECGVGSPRNQWQRIREAVKDSDPELYQRIPNRRWMKKVETPEGVVKGPVMPDELYEEFGKDGWTELPQVTEPKSDLVVPDSDFTIAALRHPVLGEFYYDRKYRSIDWRTNGGDEVSLGPSCWKLLSELLPEIMKVLGVEL